LTSSPPLPFFPFLSSFPATFNEEVKASITAFLTNKVEEKMSSSLLALTKENKQSPTLFGNPPKPKIPKTITAQLTIFDIAPVEVARQLTLRTFALYQRLERTEFFHQNWVKKQHRAKNLMAIIAFFNQVSKFVAHSILILNKVCFEFLFSN
jgi:RasGEF domain